MHRLERVGHTQFQWLEDVQHLEERYPARTGRRHGYDTVSAELANERVAKLCLVLFKVAETDDTVILLNCGGNSLRRGTCVKGSGAVLRDQPQRRS